MSDAPTATFTVNCFGCQKSLTQPFTGNDFDFKVESLISKEGWVRRDFDASARVWFCSSQCAFHSPAAIQCEEWWNNHRAEEDKRFPIWKTLVATCLTIAATFSVAFGLLRLIGK